MDITMGVSVTHHFDFEEEYNDIHPHVRVEHNNFVSGVYLNSESTVSLYAGYQFEHEDLFVDIGLVTGYSDVDVQPYVRAGYEINDNIDFFVAPGYEPAYDNIGIVAGLDFHF